MSHKEEKEEKRGGAAEKGEEQGDKEGEKERGEEGRAAERGEGEDGAEIWRKTIWCERVKNISLEKEYEFGSIFLEPFFVLFYTQAHTHTPFKLLYKLFVLL